MLCIYLILCLNIVCIIEYIDILMFLCIVYIERNKGICTSNSNKRINKLVKT